MIIQGTGVKLSALATHSVVFAFQDPVLFDGEQQLYCWRWSVWNKESLFDPENLK